MNYIDCLKLQAITFTFFTLWTAIIYGVVCHFGWGEPILLTAERIAFCISISLAYVFLGAFINMWFSSSQKGP